MGLAAKETKVGDELPVTTKSIDQTMIDSYGKLNGDSNLIHYDRDFARKCGFPDTIAHGLMTFGFISEIMTRFFGRGWVSGGKIKMIFVAPVHPGDTISAKGKVKGKAPEGEALRVVVETWCENQKGERVLVCEASGLVS